VSDRAAFESLFRAHVGAVHAYALRRSDAATADEVVADTFLVCWRRLDRVPDDALPWLYAVARRCLANRLRSGRRDRARSAPVPAVAADQTADTYEQQARAREVLTALAALPAKEREALQLCAWEGLSPADAARVPRVADADPIAAARPLDAASAVAAAPALPPGRGAPVRPRHGTTVTNRRRRASNLLHAVRQNTTCHFRPSDEPLEVRRRRRPR
jgi:RNA polymerase sigma-70 factor (ECF subfamily)